jgi:dolichol-phosphate mannosyltransferase
MKTLIIVPTYNERDNISKLIPALFKEVPGVSVLVVDDNSPDNTADVVRNLMQKNPGLHILLRPNKQGLGKAYLHAFLEALRDQTLETIVMMDADMSHDPSYLPAMLEARKHAGLVIGSRYVTGGATKGWEWWRKMLSLFGNQYCRLITRMPIHDFTAGFNAIDATLLRRLDLSQFTLGGYAFSIELKYRLWQMGAQVFEVPIVFHNRINGESKLNGHIISEGVIAPWRIVFRK